MKFFSRLIVVLGVTFAAAAAQAANPTLVKTQDGPVEGFVKNGVATFQGIPFAEPPVGALRWQPPKPHAAWTSVLQAKSFGPTCAQITSLGPFSGPTNDREDCLYLNVYSPDITATTKLPVIVWIHGGGHVDGESNDYDASKLAARGHVVVVTINYRLALFGYFAHPALDGEGHLFGNYGALDQQLALKWVKQNIAQFGGDKDNVTLGGQSAGASSSGVSVLSPLAAGLFHRAIYMSGGYNPLPTLKTAEDKGVKFAAAAGCGPDAKPSVAECLRKLPAQKIVALSGTPSTNGPYIIGPMVDGKIVPLGPHEAYKSGKFNHVPVIIGTTRDEGNFFIGITEYFSGPPRAAVTAAELKTYVAKTYGGNAGPGGALPAYPSGTADAILAQYPLSAYPSVQLMQDAIATDPVACRAQYTAQILSKQVPIHHYQFDDRTAPAYFPDMPGYKALAYHTADLLFVFPHFHGGPDGIDHPLNQQQKRLSDQLVTMWANFARTGNPNGSANKPWPFYNNKANAPSYLSQNIPASAAFTEAQFSTAHKCDFWQKILAY